MFEKYTLSTTSFPSETLDETGCDYFLFHMPGKKDHVTIDIYYSLEHHNGIHTEEVNLLDVKEANDLPSWYPLFQLSYQIDVKVTCTGFHAYVDIIYIDLSPDPDMTGPRRQILQREVISTKPPLLLTMMYLTTRYPKILQVEIHTWV